MSALKNKIKKTLVIVLSFLLSIYITQISWGTGYTIDWDNLNSGILPENSDVYSVMSSVGQQVTGKMSGGDYVLVGGFWMGYYTSGDPNGDGSIGPGDIIFLLNYLFGNGPPPDPYESGDVNCDGVVNSSDVVYLLNYLFRGGPPPLHCDD